MTHSDSSNKILDEFADLKVDLLLEDAAEARIDLSKWFLVTVIILMTISTLTMKTCNEKQVNLKLNLIYF